METLIQLTDFQDKKQFKKDWREKKVSIASCQFNLTSKNIPKRVSGIGLPVASEAFTISVVFRSASTLTAEHWKTEQTTMNSWSRAALREALNKPIVDHNIQSICNLNNTKAMKINRITKFIQGKMTKPKFHKQENISCDQQWPEQENICNKLTNDASHHRLILQYDKMHQPFNSSSSLSFWCRYDITNTMNKINNKAK